MVQRPTSTLYGHLEHEFASRLAAAMLMNSEFRRWLFNQTKFAECPEPQLLLEEMRALRSKGAKFWWKNYFTESCRCFGCSGHETDVFAVFEDATGDRFAVHIEVKQPSDRFNPAVKQGERYKVRADCWARSAPKNVPAHSNACTILVCSASKLEEFADELSWFDAVLTHEEIAASYPDATAIVPNPPKYESEYALQQRVFHEKFGHGTIAAIEGNKLEIDFEHAGRKKVLDSFVSAG